MSRERTVEQVTSTLDGWTPSSAAERKSIREQLERVLASQRFGRSKRCATLFRFIVNHALEGDVERLKERTLGVEVFGRHPDYDTNADPVVRMTAGEIRKRIAQYYHEPGHDHEIRIDLPSGSYLPEFRLPIGVAAPPVDAAKPGRKLIAFTSVIIVAALAAALAFWQKPWERQSGVEAFWQPLTSSGVPVRICVGPPDRRRTDVALNASGGGGDPATPEKAPTVLELLRLEVVALADATTLSRVSALLGAHGRSVRVQSVGSTTLADLQAGPAVLIGAFNNDWTMRVTSQWRFGFEANWNDNSFRIVDRSRPEQKSWHTDMNLPYVKLTRDYGLVARCVNPFGERAVVVAAGIGQYGTLAAGEFLTDPKYMDDLIARLPAGWRHKNIEAVITARVVDGNCGPPQVIATYVW